MTLSLMPFVVEIGIFGSLGFFPLFFLAKAKRNVVISVDVALSVEREGRDEEETSMDGRWCARGATPGVRSNEFTFHPLRIG